MENVLFQKTDHWNNLKSTSSDNYIRFQNVSDTRQQIQPIEFHNYDSTIFIGAIKDDSIIWKHLWFDN